MQETIRDAGSVPGSGRSSGAENGSPLQYSCLKIPWIEEPGGPQSMGLQRVGQDWSYLAHMQKSLCFTVGFKDGSEQQRELSKWQQTWDRLWFPESSRRGSCWAREAFIILGGWRIADQWLQSILLEAETFSLLLTIATLIAVATITTVTMVTIAISNTIAIHILFRRIRQGQILATPTIKFVIVVKSLFFVFSSVKWNDSACCVCCTKMRAWRERCVLIKREAECFLKPHSAVYCEGVLSQLNWSSR